MGILGVELSDAGIQVTGGRPARLLEVEGHAFASPGYALAQNKKVVTGQAAERMAHLYPQKILNYFWDQLSTDPLELPAKGARNQAEVAFIHLKQIWEKVRTFGDSMVMAVPDHYIRPQLGLLLGMAQELGIAVHGFWPISIAAAAKPEPGEILLYLDIHLHRLELTCMRQADRLYHTDSVTLPGKGLINWHREWVEAIASEFVQTTRFDPLHRAETEQQLYNYLPALTAELKNSTTAGIELTAGQSTYRTVISVGQLFKKNMGCLNELHRAIEEMLARWAPARNLPAALLVSHRIACLPGVVRYLSEKANVRVRELRAGAGALGVLAQWDGTGTRKNEAATVFKNSKPWAPAPVKVGEAAATAGATKQSPSHILYDSVAYPIGGGPLIIDCDLDAGGIGIHIHRDPSKAGGSHCIILQRGDRIFFEAFDVPNTTVNGQAIFANAALALGDIIRLGSEDGVTLKLIACLQNDEP